MTHYFCKEPGDTKQVTWHQDASYWPLTPSKVVTVWLAIDDADEENSAMKVIPGSHLHAQIPFEHSTVEENNVLGQSVHQAEDYGEAPVAFEMKAGQISLHTDLLLHGSEPKYLESAALRSHPALFSAGCARDGCEARLGYHLSWRRQ